MTDLETMLAVAGTSGDPPARLALADALEEAGDADAAGRQRALAELLAQHGSKFATVTIRQLLQDYGGWDDHISPDPLFREKHGGPDRCIRCQE